ncbi:hypothetical protein GCM10010909_34250 [Acidocella aquatica]|uniref:DUF1330 domain-containing protein n=1 Tax=Acidocella aquatica TaxID=1922313 RepID=A0ABQ6ABR2_9PROT|nr:DUF1330 domain-containing protein [Acidocella aquatica]GLR68743.1 hypothetical protein GCM10010909_34250 [Acidocella aquatica]
MPCYVAGQLNVHDWELYNKYIAAFVELFPGYDGRALAADNAPSVIEGEWPFSRFALLEFRDRAEAERWYHSPEYQDAIKNFRWPAASGSLLFIEGFPRRK